MADGDTTAVVHDVTDASGSSLDGALQLHLFEQIGVLVGSYALSKAGCKRLLVTTPEGTLHDLSWPRKKGATFVREGVAPEAADFLKDRIFPEATLLVLFDATDWPAAATLDVKGQSPDEETLFTTALTPVRADALLGPVIGQEIYVALAAGDEAHPDLTVDDRPLRLRQLSSQSAPETPGRRYWAHLPKRLYSGQKHRFMLTPPAPDQVVFPEKLVWSAPPMFRSDTTAEQAAERARLPAIPPRDVTLALNHLHHTWTEISSPDQSARTALAVAQPRSGTPGPVSVYVFAPMLDAAAATPAVVNLTGWYGPETRIHFVLPTRENVAFGVAAQQAGRLDQLVSLVTPEDVPARIMRQPEGSAAILLPAGAEMLKKAQAEIDTVLAGDSTGLIAPAAVEAHLGESKLVVEEDPDTAPFEASMQIGPSAPEDLAAILPQRAALRMLRPTRAEYGGLWLPGLELIGPLSRPFTRRVRDASRIHMPDVPLCLVVHGLPTKIKQHPERLRRLSALLNAMRARNCEALVTALQSSYKALPRKYPLPRSDVILAVTAEDLTALRRLGTLVPGVKGHVHFGIDEILTLDRCFNADTVAQLLRMSVAHTQLSSRLRVTANSAGHPPATLRGVCRVHRRTV